VGEFNRGVALEGRALGEGKTRQYENAQGQAHAGLMNLRPTRCKESLEQSSRSQLAPWLECNVSETRERFSAPAISRVSLPTRSACPGYPHSPNKYCSRRRRRSPGREARRRGSWAGCCNRLSRTA